MASVNPYPGRKVPIDPKVRKLLNEGYDVHKMIRGEYPNIKVKRVGRQ